MIDIRRLKELVKLMVENDLAELDLRDQQETVTVKRGATGAPVVYAPSIPAEQANAAVQQAQAEAAAPASDKAAKPAATEGLVAIESPMVGTFYSAANPDADPFVSAGTEINDGAVVCIVEAMKVFNEIKAEVSGTVEKVCVKNGDNVEFGQPRFMVRPN